MGILTDNTAWKLLKNIYNIKKFLLVVIRHYFPRFQKAIDTFHRLSAEGPTVTISDGKLRGKTDTNYKNGKFYSFQGIPYGKPPLGNLRFKDPQPVEPWSGIRDATHEGSDCVSRHVVLKTIIGSEDCLTLNVYTPELGVDKLKPVMFWIHGGGFTSGSGSTEVYGPNFLLTEDVVLVTINYRIGVLGFLSLENPDLQVPGNAGLKDIVMALRWVKKNIINFSGDPDNVTIFGESAGAAACHYLILSPMAKNLFHKAILQSGCVLNGWARGQQYKTYTDQLAKLLDIQTYDDESFLKMLRDLPAEVLLQTAEKLPDPFTVTVIQHHGPVIERKFDGAFLCENPLDIIKSGRYNHVPIIAGYTTREGMLSEIMQKPNSFKPITNFELSVPYFLNVTPGSEICKEIAKRIKEFFYGGEEPTIENKDTFYLLESDNFFIRGIIRTVKHHVQTSDCPIFLYRMSIETSLNIFKNIYNIKERGVCHADDLGYLFMNLLTPDIKPGSDEEIAITRFVKFWTNFAKFGNPNPKTKNPHINIKWKRVTKTEMNFLDIGNNLTAAVDPEKERMTFWDKIFQISNNNF